MEGTLLHSRDSQELRLLDVNGRATMLANASRPPGSVTEPRCGSNKRQLESQAHNGVTLE